MKRLIASTLLIVALSLPALATPQIVATHAVFGEIATLVGGDQIEVTLSSSRRVSAQNTTISLPATTRPSSKRIL